MEAGGKSVFSSRVCSIVLAVVFLILQGALQSAHYFQELGFCINFSVTGVTEVNLSGVTLVCFFSIILFSHFFMAG